MCFNYVLLYTLYVNEENGLFFFFFLISYMQQWYQGRISSQMGEVQEWRMGEMQQAVSD